MPQLNVDTVDILNEADLTNVASPVLTDVVHLTQGRKAELSAIKTTILNGENTANTTINSTALASTVRLELATGTETSTETLSGATTTLAGVLIPEDKIKINSIPSGGITGAETIIDDGTNTVVDGSGTVADPYRINASGGGAGTAATTTSTPSGNLTSTNVQDALEELQADVNAAGKPNVLSDSTVYPSVDNISFNVLHFDVTSQPGDTAYITSLYLDEDDMVSDSNTMSPTQQSVKAYVDANSGSVGNSQETLNVNSNSTTTLVPVDNRFYRLNKSGIGSLTTLLTIDNSSLINGSTFYLAYDGFGNSDAAVQIDVTAGQIEPINIASDGTSSFIMKRGEIVKVVVNNTFLTVASLNQPLLDEDDLVSNSSTQAPTQQSVKAYVDANAGGGGSAATVTYDNSASGLTAITTQDAIDEALENIAVTNYVSGTTYADSALVNAGGVIYRNVAGADNGNNIPGVDWEDTSTPEGYVFSTTAPKKGERWVDTTPGPNELYEVKVFNGIAWEVIEYYDDTNGLFSKEKPWYVLVIGQSNTMTGFSGAGGITKNDDRVTFYNIQTNRWEIADLEGVLYIPGKVNYPGTDNSFENATNTPAFPVDYSIKLANETGRNVRLVMSSHGGNPIENWTDNANRPNWDTLVSQMAQNGVNQVFDQVIFHQGESNSQVTTGNFDSVDYVTQLTKLRTDLQAEGWISFLNPYIVGEIANTRGPEVNLALRSWAESEEWVGYARGADLETLEGTHFTALSKNIQGRSYYWDAASRLPHEIGDLREPAVYLTPTLSEVLTSGNAATGETMSLTSEELFEPVVYIENTSNNQADGTYTLHVDNSTGNGGDNEGGLLVEGGGTSYMKYNSRGTLILKSRSSTAYDALILEGLRTTGLGTSMIVEQGGAVQKRDISTFPLFPIGSSGADLSNFTVTADANSIGTGLTVTNSSTLNSPATGMLYTSRFNSDVTNQMHQQLVTGLLRTRAKHPSNSGDTWTSWTVVGGVTTKGLTTSIASDANGQAIISHSFGVNPTAITCRAQGLDFYHVQVVSQTTTQFVVKVFDASGNPVAATFTLISQLSFE
jgi:hypothetical protein